MKGGRSAILRFFQIIFAVLKHLTAYVATSILTSARRGDSLRERHPLLREISPSMRLRLFLIEVDGLLIKIGQILAMRVDFLPEASVQELIKLLDEVPPFRSDTAMGIIEEELGAPITELYEYFEPTPMAAASFAQVHAARLPGGKEVVVKVQRPGVADTMAADLKIFRTVAFLADATGLTQRTPLKPVYQEFAAWTAEELDFRVEGSHVQEIYEKAKKSPTEKIPRVYWSRTSRRVLTLERLRGIWVKEIMQELVTDRKKLVARLEEDYNTSLKAISQNLLRNTLRQIFEYGVYHSDPHGGNLMVMKGGRIGYVDFGITGRIGQKAREQQVNIHIALESGDFERFYNAILDTIDVPYLADLWDFKRELGKNYAVWLRAQYMGSRNIREKSFARLMLAINKSAQNAGIGFRSMEVRIFRTLATVDAILLDFSPRLDVRAEFRSFFTKYNLKTLAHVDIPQIFQRLPAAIRSAAEHLDVQVVSVIARVSKLRLTMSRIFLALSAAAAVFAVLVVIGIHLVVGWIAAIGVTRGRCVVLAAILAVFSLWLGHMLRLHSVVHDEVLLPPERAGPRQRRDRPYDGAVS